MNKKVPLTLKMNSDWYKASNALYRIIGYDTFEEYVADCVKYVQKHT